jgi:AraC family transcriptional regulator
VATDLPNLARLDYAGRVNRAIDHATRHLAEPLRLSDLAGAAHFSSYHFHRIFSALMGETVNAFVKRIRLERALYLMSHDPGLSLTEVALRCGFASSSDFSRNFRARYGVSPRAFDIGQFRTQQRESLVQDIGPAPAETDAFEVRLSRVPARRVAYVRVFNPYAGGVPEAAGRLVAWAEARGLDGGQWLGYQWEDPETVPLEQCRYDVAVQVPSHVTAQDDIGTADFPALTLAEIDVSGPIERELSALDHLYRTWLPSSGYVPAHQPCFEAWTGRPFDGPADQLSLTVQLPVTRAGGGW